MATALQDMKQITLSSYGSFTKFRGEPTRRPQFIDSHTAAIVNSKSFSKVETFNYLRSFSYGEGLRSISGFTSTNGNYDEAMDLTKNRFGKSQSIVIDHMNAL